jgi:hypothetical protein
MSVSVQELDNTVRAFYEGKGDVVSPLSLIEKKKNGKWKRKRTELTMGHFRCSKNKHSNLLRRYDEN